MFYFQTRSDLFNMKCTTRFRNYCLMQNKAYKERVYYFSSKLKGIIWLTLKPRHKQLERRYILGGWIYKRTPSPWVRWYLSMYLISCKKYWKINQFLPLPKSGRLFSVKTVQFYQSNFRMNISIKYYRHSIIQDKVKYQSFSLETLFRIGF